jgi:hypothetical protein
MPTVRISGNWRNPSKMELAGTLTIDREGRLERGLNLTEEVYQAIERALAEGKNEGAVYATDGTRVEWFADR